MSRLVLIDGNAIVHRAYHALPPLTSPDGKVVNAVYGFFSMLLKILEESKPEYLAVCFDRAAPTFRQQMYVAYQQHRPAMSDDLSSQFPIIQNILEKCGVQLFGVDGYEADDLIGTIASLAVNKKLSNEVIKETKNKLSNYPITQLPETEVIIVSGDRDLLQLVNHRVKMLAPITGITNMTLFDSKKVLEKYGLTPPQIIDYKALVGDPSDGYPGITGIGPKTASTLLQKYGTFENVYQHLGELSPKLSQALATDAEQAALARKLATIVTDAPIQFDIEKCSMEHFSMEKLKEEFKKLGFKSLLKRWEEAEGNQDKVSKVSEVSKANKGKNKTVADQLGLL